MYLTTKRIQTKPYTNCSSHQGLDKMLEDDFSVSIYRTRKTSYDFLFRAMALFMMFPTRDEALSL